MESPSKAATKAASVGAGWVDNFRLRGSSRCRRKGEYSTETRLFTWMVHAFDNHNASLSEGSALAVVVRDFHETPHQTRNDKHFARLMRQSEARLCPACAPLASCGGAPHERGAGGGSDPTFFVAGASPARVNRRVQWRAINPPLGAVAPSTVIPSGRLSNQGRLVPERYFLLLTEGVRFVSPWVFGMKCSFA